MPLAFPSPAAKRFEEEDVSSPSPATASNSPAFAIDPGLLDQEHASNPNYFQYETHPPQDFRQPNHFDHQEQSYVDDLPGNESTIAYSRDYPPGPPPEPILYPEPEEPPIVNAPRKPPKKPRRERKPRKEPNCGFCLGDNSRNKEQVPEHMLSCSNCGRSGHPSCLEIAHISDVVYNYSWECIECKKCEVCKEKGDDTKLLFCDNCDRGWHYDCLEHPLASAPEGNWNCPYCPALLEENFASTSYGWQQSENEVVEDEEAEFEGDEETEEPVYEETSAAQLGTPKPRKTPSRPRKTPKSSKGKGKAKSTPVAPPPLSTPRLRKPRPSQRGSSRAIPSSATQNQALSSAVQTPGGQPKVTFRLRLGKHRRNHSSDDEHKSQFENFLSPEEYDTTKTVVVPEDKTRFEKSRVAAENKLQSQISHLSSLNGAEGSSHLASTTSHRPLRSFAHLAPPDIPSTPGGSFTATISTPGLNTPVPSYPFPHAHAPHVPSSLSLSTLASVAVAASLSKSKNSANADETHYGKQPSSLFPDSHHQPAVPLRIRSIRFGQWDVDTWYDAPFPEEYNNIPEGRLWMCEFCLRYMKSGFGWERHQTKCRARHPPGDEIYRDGTISVFEVDGRRNKIYCQNLCLLSKMFLDHKSLFYDVEPFLFYVMTEVDDSGAHFVGYFSKEKRSAKECNLSCIMTLPVRQRKGWGNLLIDFSYLLSKKEQRPGSPERPLSALGALSYRSYWTLALMQYLRNAPIRVTFEMISAATGMMISDIVVTLREQGMLTVYEKPSTPIPASPLLRGSKGKARHRPRSSLSTYTRRNSTRKIIQEEKEDAISEPSTPTSYSIHWDKEVVEQYLAKWNAKGYLTLKPDQLKWSPYLLSRASILETPPAPTLGDEPSSASGAVDVAATSVASSTVLPNGGGSGPGSASGDGGATAVEQVANGSYPDAGPSNLSPPLTSVMYRISPSSPSTTNQHLDADDDKDSEFEPDEFEETPTRSRARPVLLKPTRMSQRTLSRNASEMSDTTRSVATSDRRLTRRRSAVESNAEDRFSFPPIAGSSSSRQSSLRGQRSSRKRKRVDSPDSSLTEPSYTRTESPSVAASDEDEDEEEVPRARRFQATTNGNGGGRSTGRRTRSSTNPATSESSRGAPRPNRRNSSRLNGRANSIVIIDEDDDEEDTRPPLRPPGLPDHYVDDPEDALRKRKRARLDEALGKEQPSAIHPLDDHRQNISSPNGTASPSTRTSTLLSKLNLNGNGGVVTNGNGVGSYSHSSPDDTGFPPQPDGSSYPGSGADFSVPEEDEEMDEDVDAIGEADPDVDAEGEEEVFNAVYQPLDQPFEQEDDGDMDDLDAEGEIDLDAEGEEE